MWILPGVSGHGQCPAVNISAAWNLEIAHANQGHDPDRYAVYARFGKGVEDRVPLVEVICSNGNNMVGLERAQQMIDLIINALEQGTKVLDLNP